MISSDMMKSDVSSRSRPLSICCDVYKCMCHAHKHKSVRSRVAMICSDMMKSTCVGEQVERWGAGVEYHFQEI